MTTIPSVAGWHIAVDGKTVKADKVANYFIGIKTKPGRHTISMTYTPPFLWLGLATTTIATVILVIFSNLSIAKKVTT